jgi:ADP-ribose pyrophosphatase
MSARRIYAGRIITLWLEDATLPTGRHLTLEIVHHPGASAVVALDAQNEVTLVRQFRHAAGGYIWEVPAGTLGADEDPADCAARELREEAGLVAGQWTPLGSIFTTPGFCNERIHLFLARRLSGAEQALDDDEVLTVGRVPLRQALEMIAAGEINDAKSIAALYRAAAVLGRAD